MSAFAHHNPFVVMTKPVGSACNMQCSYCYYRKTDKEHTEGTSPCMSDDLLELFIQQYIEANPGPIISFTWHGGEPTLAGLPFYRKVVELQNKYLPSGWECWNNLQTNGLLLDDEWCAFLAQNHFDVGLSIDGTRLVHDKYRKDTFGNNTYDRVCESARRLLSHGIRADLLCTVTSLAATHPLDVYRGLRELNTGWMQFIPIIRRSPSGAVTADSVTPDQYGSFLCTVFDEWVLHDMSHTGIQFFAESMLVLNGGEASLCWMSPTCGRVLIAEKDGTLFSCDHFVDSGHNLGNLYVTPLSQLANHPRQLAFGAEKLTGLTTQCQNCPWLSLCNGGCPKDRFATTASGEPGLYYLCHGLQSFFAHAVPVMKDLVSSQFHCTQPN